MSTAAAAEKCVAAQLIWDPLGNCHHVITSSRHHHWLLKCRRRTWWWDLTSGPKYDIDGIRFLFVIMHDFQPPFKHSFWVLCCVCEHLSTLDFHLYHVTPFSIPKKCIQDHFDQYSAFDHLIDCASNIWLPHIRPSNTPFQNFMSNEWEPFLYFINKN